MKWRPAPATALLLVSLVAGCAHGIPEPVAHPSIPHISWLVTATDEAGRELRVCRSDPREPCSVTRGASATPTLITVHIYSHPTDTATTYVGSARITFIREGNTGADLTIDQITSSNGRPINSSITGRLVPTAGTYQLRIQIIATPDKGPAIPLDDIVDVEVR